MPGFIVIAYCCELLGADRRATGGIGRSRWNGSNGAEDADWRVNADVLLPFCLAPGRS